MIAKCCVANCNKIVSRSNFLNHMISDHIHQDLSNLQEINCKERTILWFDEDILDFGENVCVGVFLYARNRLVSKYS